MTAILLVTLAGWLSVGDGRVQAERDGLPALVYLEPAPPATPFAAWVVSEVATIDAKRALPAQCTTTAEVDAFGDPRAKGGLAVVDWQWEPVALVRASAPGGAAAWSRALRAALKKAEAQGEEKKKWIATLEREVAAAEAEEKQSLFADAVKRARPVIEAEAKIRCPAIDRARKLVERVHDEGMEKIREIEEEHDKIAHGPASQRAAGQRAWAAKTVKLVPGYRKQFPFPDVQEKLSNIEATATAYLAQPGP